MKQIVKIIFDDQTAKRRPKPNALKIPATGFMGLEASYNHKQKWKSQNAAFDITILENIDPAIIAEFTFGHRPMKHVENAEEDLTDEFILNEIAKRKLFGNIDYSLINENFMVRFSKIVAAENQIVLDSLLDNLEKKLNL